MNPASAQETGTVKPRITRDRAHPQPDVIGAALATDSAPGPSQPAIFSRAGTPPECTTLPSTTTPGVARMP